MIEQPLQRDKIHRFARSKNNRKDIRSTRRSHPRHERQATPSSARDSRQAQRASAARRRPDEYPIRFRSSTAPSQAASSPAAPTAPCIRRPKSADRSCHSQAERDAARDSVSSSREPRQNRCDRSPPSARRFRRATRRAPSISANSQTHIFARSEIARRPKTQHCPRPADLSLDFSDVEDSADREGKPTARHHH